MSEVSSKEKEMRDPTYEIILKRFQSWGIKMTMGDAARLRRILAECRAYNKKAGVEKKIQTVSVNTEALVRWIEETFGGGALNQFESIRERLRVLAKQGVSDDERSAWGGEEYRKLFTFLEQRRQEQREADEWNDESFSVPHL